MEKFLSVLGTMFLLTAFGCSNKILTLHDELYVPQVSLNSSEQARYLDDVSTCRLQVFGKYREMHDIRNANADFRACLINKGYMLLS